MGLRRRLLGRDPAVRGHPIPGRRPVAGARASVRRHPARLPRRALRARPPQHRARHPEPDGRGRGLRRGGGDVPALAGRGRAAGGRDARPLRPRAELRRRREDPAAVRRPRALPGGGRRAGDHPAPRAHARGGEGGPLARAQRHEGQLQPDLPDVPGPDGGVRGNRPRRDRPPAGGAVRRRRQGRAPDVARRGDGPDRPLPGPPRRRPVVHRGRAPPARDGAPLPGRGRPRRGVDARLLHADRGAGAAGPPVPPDPVRGAVARAGEDAPRLALPARPVAGRRAGRRRGGELESTPRLRLGLGRGWRARGRGRARSGKPALARGPGLPARARHVLPAPRGARSAPRRAGGRRSATSTRWPRPRRPSRWAPAASPS